MKQLLTIISLGLASAVTAQTACSEPFISEYIEGSSNNKAIEIFNPTSSALAMDNYSLAAFNNGNTSPTNTFSFPAGTTIPAHGTFVIANASADPAILAVAGATSTVTYFNGDDAIVLFKNSDTLDIIGIVGIDPGSSWTVGSGSTANHTLVRKNTVTAGQTDWAVGVGEWDVHSSNTFTYVGSHSSTCGGSGGGGGGTTSYPSRAIIELKGVNSNGEADSLNATAKITGVVTSPDWDGNDGYQIYIQDSTAGLMIYSSSDLGTYQSALGDQLEVYGSVAQYKGLIEFAPDSIHVVAQNAALPAPDTVTTLDESVEGKLVYLYGFKLVDATQWTQTGTGFNVEITNGTNTAWMRIDDVSDWYAMSAPSGWKNITGVVGQYDPSTPLDSGYQVFPRFQTDITASDVSVIECPENRSMVYPNPAQHMVLVLTHGQPATLHWANALGQVVRTEQILGDEVLQVADLERGLYTMTIEWEDGSRQIHKVLLR